MAARRWRLFCGAIVTMVAVCLVRYAPAPSSISVVVHAQTPATQGQWSAVQAWPAVAVHAHLLPTGKVLFWPYSDEPRLWDPQNGAITAAANSGFNLFCTGHSFLADGRLFVAGGHISNSVGLPNAAIYDPFANSWTRLPDMNAGRWYPTATTLPNGDVLVMSGDIDTTVGHNNLPQVWETAAGRWRDLWSAQPWTSLYPFLHLAPNGQVIMTGADATTRYLDPAGSGSLRFVADSNFGYRDYGTSVLYDDGKILLVGGGDPPTATAEVIDLNAQTPTWTYVAPMSIARRHLNGTILPDGKLLITGGSSGAGFDNETAPVFSTELWDPVTRQFSTLASATQYRGYHSTAMLLPDGRVLSTGGDHSQNAEVFSPPYLFKGARPTISSAPASVAYGQTFFIGTADATSITKATWIRLTSTTHAFNMDQRIDQLTFTATTGGLNVVAPADPNLSPPGYYMLFLLNGNGVPSVARMIRINVPPSAPPAAPTSLTATAISNSQINLAWTDNANSESGFQIERSLDGTTFTPTATVPANVTTYSNSGLSTATTFYYRVQATNVAGGSAWSNVANARTGTPISPVPFGPTAISLPGTIQAEDFDHGGERVAYHDLSVGNEGAQYRSTDVDIEPSSDTNGGYNIGWAFAGEWLVYSVNVAAAGTYTLEARVASNGVGGTFHVEANGANVTGTMSVPNTGGWQVWQTVTKSVTLAAGPQLFRLVFDTNGPTTAVANVNFIRIAGAAPQAPAAPSNLAATVTSNTQINLTWTDNATNEGGFQIERSSSAGTFTAVATVGANVTSYQNTGLAPGTWYTYRVKASTAAGLSAPSNEVTARTTGGASPTPFSGVPSAIPGTIQAENFDNGGEGVAYHDGSTGNNGGQYRNTDVDVEGTSDTGGGFNVGWMGDGEWLLYTVNVATAGTYTVEARVASSGLGGTFHIEVNGVNVSGTMSVPDTGGWQTWQTITKSFPLNVGPQSLRVVLDVAGPSGGVGNLNFLRFTAAGATTPTAPTSLGATAVSSSQINLAWTDNSSNETGFAIERSPDGVTFAPLTTVGANVTTYQNTGLATSTTYHYRVRATNAVGPSGWSNVANATTTGTAPAAPTNLTATAVSSSQINLAWTDNSSNETGFAIERSPDGVTFAPLTTVGANVTTYQNTGLVASTTYHYRVRATNAVGPSGWSNVANATTTATVLAAPTNLVATAVSSSQINLAWADNSSDETGFAIERSPDGLTFTPLTTVAASVTTYQNTGLAASTTYHYRVRATNAVGPSGWSNVANATTTGTVPAAPTNLVATAGSSSQINLVWTDNAANETGFAIERSSDGITFTALATVGANVSTYANTGLTPATRFFYRVRATNAAGPSAWSNVADAQTANTVPTAPSNLTASPVSNSQIDLSWADRSTNETNFVIERSTNGSLFSALATVGPNVTTYSDTGLAAFTRYYYRVRATNDVGNSGWSNVANARTRR